MSWFKKALSISTPEPGAYYTAIDPVEFYEWRFNQFIPKGSVFTEKLPRSDIFTKGQVIVSVKLPNGCLEKRSFGYELSKDIKADAVLMAGQIVSPMELIEKHKALREEFDRGLAQFKKTCEARQFMASIGDEPHLYQIKGIDGNNVDLENFGPVTEVLERLNVARQELGKEASKKIGKAHELEKYRRFENSMVLLDSLDLPLDAPKTNFLLTTAGIKSSQTRHLLWKQCFIELSEDASRLASRLDAFQALNWVKQTVNYMKMFN